MPEAGLTAQQAFREACAAGRMLSGTFQKTPSRQVAEVLALSGLDFVVIDAEHAPFGAAEIDAVAGACRPMGFPALVRVPDARGGAIGACLDAGAAGVVVPHVRSAEEAEAAVAAARFTGGARGLSPSGRAGDYGAYGLVDFMQRSDAAVSVWCQIEDVEAIDRIEEIAAVPGVDALFVGRADLMRSMGAETVGDVIVADAVVRVAAAVRGRGPRLAIHLGHAAEAEAFAEMGFTLFLIGSDQAMLRAQGASTATAIRTLGGSRAE